MINSLSIATKGRVINKVRKTLTLATIGWLIVSTIINPEEPVIPNNNTTSYQEGVGSGGFPSNYKEINYLAVQEKNKQLKLERKIRDERDILEPLKIIMTCLD